MCGIAGIVHASGAPADGRAADAMGRTLAHRGPDGEGLFVEGPVALAHRRLSILDLEGGAQPMTSASGRSVVVFNGEIYNYRTLRERLARLGQELRTESDTEVILAAYERWGQEGFATLRGMFAFALWDRERRSLFLARDPLGIKPLYVARDRDRILFASEIKAILRALPARPALRDEAINAYFRRQYIEGEETIFEGIECLGPGSIREIRVHERAIADRALFRFPCSRPSRTSLREASHALESMLLDAVRSHMVSDVPVGVFLSGGLDSSALVALASRTTNEPLRTFSVGFGDERFDEVEHARRVARHFGTRHHELRVSAAEGLAALPRIVAHLDQPLADYAIVPTYVMSAFAAQHVKVVLGGEGADELFGGYRMRYLPHVLAELAGGVVAPATLHGPRLLGERGRARLLGERFVPDRDLGSERAVRSDLRRFARSGPINAALATDARHWLPGDLLVKVDAMGMLASLEARVPYLDRELVEHVSTWGGSLKLGPHETKRVLRRMAAPLLPGAIAARPKHGFTVPVDAWFRRELRKSFEEVVLATPALDAWISRAHAGRTFRAHQRGASRGHVLFAIYVFASWLMANGALH